jgi:hypothetical protein
MQQGIVVLGLVVAVATLGWSAALVVPGSHGFTKEQLAWLHKAVREMTEHSHAGRFEQAEGLARARLELFERVLGGNH